MDILADVLKLSRNLIMKEPFYGMFLSTLNKTITTKVPVAGVRKNGINLEIAFNPEAWKQFPEHLRYGILKHELLHICFFHTTMRDKYADKKLFNIAADIEVNQYIENKHKDDSFLNHEDYNLKSYMGTDYYYKELEKQKGKNPKLDQLLQSMEDYHSSWEEIEESSNVEKQLMDKQVKHQMADAKRNIKNFGDLPEKLQELLRSLDQKPESVIDWKAFFRRFTGGSTKYFTKKSRRKQSNRFEDSPGLKIKQKNHVFIALDTSGSVSNEEFAEFSSELHHIYKSGTDITVCHTDAAVAHVELYKGKLMDRHGYGGTDFNPAIKHFNEHKNKYTAMVYFTDGECVAPTVKPHKPILWVISSRGKKLETLPGLQVKITNK